MEIMIPFAPVRTFILQVHDNVADLDLITNHVINVLWQVATCIRETVSQW